MRSWCPSAPGTRAPWRGRSALAAPLVLGMLMLGATSAAADPAPTPSSQSSQSSRESRSDVEEARAAEEATAAEVKEIGERYDEASAALRTVQGEVSEAATAYAEAVADLERVTAAADTASARAAATRRLADRADRLVREDAASAYMQGAGPMNRWAIYLSADGFEDFMDLHADMQAIGSVHEGHLVDAQITATAAASDRAAAEAAQSAQADATAAVQSNLEAAQRKVAEASALATRIEKQQRELVAELAAARRTTEEAEQARLDELEAAAKAAAGAAGGSAALPQVGSGGSPELTAAQLDPRSVAREMLGGSDAEWTCLDRLWFAESGWRWSATNSSSGAYGIPQALPGSKMASAGADWLVNPRTQIAWGLGYIDSRYGTPCGAWKAFLSRSPHWY